MAPSTSSSSSSSSSSHPHPLSSPSSPASSATLPLPSAPPPPAPLPLPDSTTSSSISHLSSDQSFYSFPSSSSSASPSPSLSEASVMSDTATITAPRRPSTASVSPSSPSPQQVRQSSFSSTASSSSRHPQDSTDELELNGTSSAPRLQQWEASWDEQEDDDDDSAEDDIDDGNLLTGARSSREDGAPVPGETAQERRERRRRERRVYGGGRHRHGLAEGGDENEEEGGEQGRGEMSLGEVAGVVLASSLSPTPLLLPLACARLGPALFVPLLVLAGALGWLSAVVVGVEGRYVGARSFPALASSVFPHRFKLHLLGELLAVLYVFLASVVRSVLDVVAAAEVAVDLFVPEKKRRDWERSVVVGGLCLTWLLVPLILPPLLSALGLSSLLPSSSSSASTSPSARYSRLASTSTPDLSTSSSLSPYTSSAGPSCSSERRPRPRWSALLRLPAWSIAVIAWPLALLILGVRLKRLNRDTTITSSFPPLDLLVEAQKASSHAPLFNPLDPNGASLWPSILLPFAALLGTSHETFYYLTSLARPSSTSTIGGRRHMSLTAGVELPPSGGAAGEVERGGGVGGGGSKGGAGAGGGGRRNQYPLAIALGLSLSFLIHLGWGLVGSLGFLPPSKPDTLTLPASNVLSDPRLPRSDPWLAGVRVLVLVGVVAQISGHSRFAIGRGRRALSFLFPSRSSTSSFTASTSSSTPTTPSHRRKALFDTLSRLVTYSLIFTLGLLVVSLPKVGREGEGGRREVGGHGTGLAWVGMWVGAVGSGVGGCVGPALAYLVLFHLHPPRNIFTTSTSSPHFTSDPLLQRKERQVQRRLSGRRVWTDVAVFGVLGPVGAVLVGRGIWGLTVG